MTKHHAAAAKPLFFFTLALFGCILSGCGDKISDRDIEFALLPEVRSLVLDKPGTARLVDPRSPAEFAAGRIPGAVNLQLNQVSETKDSIDPALARFKTVLVYGNDPGSGLARAMTKRLLRAGHPSVKMFPGGFAEWQSAGLKIEVTPITPDTNAKAAPISPVAPDTGFGKPLQAR